VSPRTLCRNARDTHVGSYGAGALGNAASGGVPHVVCGGAGVGGGVASGPASGGGMKWHPGMKCHLCGLEIPGWAGRSHPLRKSRDHVIPWSKGGRELPFNCRPAHAYCNSYRKTAEITPELQRECRKRIVKQFRKTHRITSMVVVTNWYRAMQFKTGEATA
jgi:hypothetical protein